MALIVDGNNVLHSAMPAMLDGLGVAGLCRALARTPWAKQGVTVVCDGHPGVLGTIESPVPEVELVWSGHGRTADALIIARIEAHPAPRSLTVVSTDREIRLEAKSRGATVWTSDAFIARLAEALRRPQTPTPDKPADPRLGDDEVRDWLRAFGVSDPPPPRPATPAKGPGRSQSPKRPRLT